MKKKDFNSSINYNKYFGNEFWNVNDFWKNFAIL